jgi:hypothetical protein
MRVLRELVLGLERFDAWLTGVLRPVDDACSRAAEWLGFTPTQRERFLERRLLAAAALATEQRIVVGRVERLLRYRESLGATTIDTVSIRQALYGDDDMR